MREGAAYGVLMRWEVQTVLSLQAFASLHMYDQISHHVLGVKPQCCFSFNSESVIHFFVKKQMQSDE